MLTRSCRCLSCWSVGRCWRFQHRLPSPRKRPGGRGRGEAKQYSGDIFMIQIKFSFLPPNFLSCPYLSPCVCRKSFRDVLLGLEYLHYQKIIHRFLAVHNLICNQDIVNKFNSIVRFGPRVILETFTLPGTSSPATCYERTLGRSVQISYNESYLNFYISFFLYIFYKL